VDQPARDEAAAGAQPQDLLLLRCGQAHGARLLLQVAGDAVHDEPQHHH
ncbi:hypothetical protein BN1708_019507, partial [Verticillium longisporum]